VDVLLGYAAGLFSLSTGFFDGSEGWSEGSSEGIAGLAGRFSGVCGTNPAGGLVFQTLRFSFSRFGGFGL
jgi:hypothetical protein